MTAEPAETAVPALRIRGLSKTFAGQRALDDVTVDIPRGKITALLGMNGSGKSTLVKILAGVYQPDGGAHLEIGGAAAGLPLTPASAHRAGLRFLHQDLGLVDSLTIADNFAFADRFRARGVLGPINHQAQHRHVARTLALFDIAADPGTLVAALNPTVRTMIGLARAFQDEEELGAEAFGRNIVVLDEPTASLPAGEVDAILTALEKLCDIGGTVIYVSHRIEEVERIADQLVILRDGRLVADEPTADLRVDDIVARVVGERLTPAALGEPTEREGEVVLEVDGLRGPRLRGVSLRARAGEILGIAGLVGCGRSELIRMLAGAQSPDAGEIRLDARPYRPRGPADAIAAGVACVPQERRREGVVLPMSTTENLTLGRLGTFSRRGVLGATRERRAALQMVSEYGIKPPDLGRTVALLSGGNQQKVVVARAAGGTPRVLLLDEPTQGVDALAKQEIWNSVRRLAAEGVTIVLASTDTEEFVGLCDRVVVLNRGRQVATASGEDITEERLTVLCTQKERAA